MIVMTAAITMTMATMAIMAARCCGNDADNNVFKKVIFECD